MSQFFTNTHEAYPDIAPDQEVIQSFPGQIKSVSFSGMTTFEQCPYQIYLDKVAKVGRAKHKAADRGSNIHDMLEKYVLGEIDTLKLSMMKSGDFHEPLLTSFREKYLTGHIEPELKLAFTREMEVTGWDSPNMWLRGAIDVVEWGDQSPTAILYDYKSGSNSSAAKHRSQLMLYAMMIFIAYPEVAAIRVAAIYVDHKLDNFYTDYTQKDVAQFWPRYQQRLQRVTDCTKFSPNPNGFTCRFCQHKKAQESLSQVEPACSFAHVG